ncbi:MAG: hypothetical protein V7K21_28240 [Nostoc sp.]
MIIAQIESQIRYVTNTEGETTDVLVLVELWQQIAFITTIGNLIEFF